MVWDQKDIEQEMKYLEGMNIGTKPKISREYFGFYRLYSGVKKDGQRKVLMDNFFGRLNEAVSYLVLQPENYAHHFDIEREFDDNPANMDNGYVSLIKRDGIEEAVKSY